MIFVVFDIVVVVVANVVFVTLFVCLFVGADTELLNEYFQFFTTPDFQGNRSIPNPEYS